LILLKKLCVAYLYTLLFGKASTWINFSVPSYVAVANMDAVRKAHVEIGEVAAQAVSPTILS